MNSLALVEKPAQAHTPTDRCASERIGTVVIRRVREHANAAAAAEELAAKLRQRLYDLD